MNLVSAEKKIGKKIKWQRGNVKITRVGSSFSICSNQFVDDHLSNFQNIANFLFSDKLIMKLLYNKECLTNFWRCRTLFRRFIQTSVENSSVDVVFSNGYARFSIYKILEFSDGSRLRKSHWQDFHFSSVSGEASTFPREN